FQRVGGLVLRQLSLLPQLRQRNNVLPFLRVDPLRVRQLAQFRRDCRHSRLAALYPRQNFLPPLLLLEVRRQTFDGRLRPADCLLTRELAGEQLLDFRFNRGSLLKFLLTLIVVVLLALNLFVPLDPRRILATLLPARAIKGLVHSFLDARQHILEQRIFGHRLQRRDELPLTRFVGVANQRLIEDRAHAILLRQKHRRQKAGRHPFGTPLATRRSHTPFQDLAELP